MRSVDAEPHVRIRRRSCLTASTGPSHCVPHCVTTFTKEGRKGWWGWILIKVCVLAFSNTRTRTTPTAIVTDLQGEFPAWNDVVPRCGVVMHMARELTSSHLLDLQAHSKSPLHLTFTHTSSYNRHVPCLMLYSASCHHPRSIQVQVCARQACPERRQRRT